MRACVLPNHSHGSLLHHSHGCVVQRAAEEAEQAAMQDAEAEAADRRRQEAAERRRQEQEEDEARRSVWLLLYTVKSCIKAAASMTFLMKFCRLLYETGFYTREVFLCMSTLKPGLSFDRPKIAASIRGRLLFKCGFYTILYGTLFIVGIKRGIRPITMDPLGIKFNPLELH